MSIPKPKHCGQNWLEMTPVEGGRICGGCNKLIIDFTRSTWREIEAIQAANNNAVCGMYTDKQLENWGQQPPTNSCTKLAASLALFASLASATPANAQQDTSEVRTIISGYVFNADDSAKPYANVTVWVKGSRVGTITNEAGYYELDITSYLQDKPNAVISYYFLATYENLFEIGDNRGHIHHDTYLKTDTNSLELSTFYITTPKLKDKLKHKLKKREKN